MVETKQGTLVIEKEVPREETDPLAPAEEKAATKAEEPREPEKMDEPKTRERRSNAELLNLIVQCGDNARDYAKQVVETELARDIFAQDWGMAKVFAMSGQFDDLKKLSRDQAIATAMAKIQLGRSWGVGAADSMRFVFFTNGKPSIETELFGKALQASGYQWDVAYDYDEKTKRCIGVTIFPQRWNANTGEFEPILMKRRTKEGGWEKVQLEVSFTKEDADGAKIWEGGKQIPLSQKWNFQSWPEDMYFWRALSRFRRRHAPNVLAGAMLRDEAQDTQPEPTPAKPLFEKKEAAA